MKRQGAIVGKKVGAFSNGSFLFTSIVMFQAPIATKRKRKEGFTSVANSAEVVIPHLPPGRRQLPPPTRYPGAPHCQPSLQHHHIGHPCC